MATVRRLVAFYVDEHNRVLPHSAFRGQTPDEMYFGTGDTIPADLRSRTTLPATHALKRTDQRRARHARQSTRPLTIVPSTGSQAGHVCLVGESAEPVTARSHEWDADRVRDPWSLRFSGCFPDDDENSHREVQNVRADSLAID